MYRDPELRYDWHGRRLRLPRKQPAAGRCQATRHAVNTARCRTSAQGRTQQSGRDKLIKSGVVAWYSFRTCTGRAGSFPKCCDYMLSDPWCKPSSNILCQSIMAEDQMKGKHDPSRLSGTSVGCARTCVAFPLASQRCHVRHHLVYDRPGSTPKSKTQRSAHSQEVSRTLRPHSAVSRI